MNHFMPTELNIDGCKVLKNVPEDINAELLFSCLPDGKLKVEFEGTHKRNAYHDIIDLVQEGKDNPITLHLGRASLYHNLPEAMFHPIIGRFDVQNDKEFEEKYQAQKNEIENAKKFFAPIDLLLLKIRLVVRGKIQECLKSEKLLVDIIIKDRLSESEKQNRFIQKTLPFLPMCKFVRGNKTLITLMLQNILEDENVEIKIRHESKEFQEDAPRYPGVVGDTLDAFYLGDSYVDDVLIYDVHYWSDEECAERFMEFVNDMEAFRVFLQDYFFAVGAELRFDISTDSDGFYLYDETKPRYQYLNYNTNL